MKLPLIVVFAVSLVALTPSAQAMRDTMGYHFAGCGQITALDSEEARILMPGNDEFVISRETSAYEKRSEGGSVRFDQKNGAQILAGLEQGQCLCIKGAMPAGGPLFRMRSYLKSYETTLIFRTFPVSCSRQKQAVIEYVRQYNQEESSNSGDLGPMGGGFGHM